MTTYFKVPLANLFPIRHRPKTVKVKTMIFRDNEEAHSIECISLDTYGRFICYEQWSIQGNEHDYRKCREELCGLISWPLYPSVGKWVFDRHEDKMKMPSCSQLHKQQIWSNPMTRSDICESETLL